METLHEEALAAADARPDGMTGINVAMRSILEGLLNAVMNEQASKLGVSRNGYRERGLDTHVGTVTFRLLKLRRAANSPAASCATGRAPTPRSPRRYAACCFRSPRPGRPRRPKAETTRDPRPWPTSTSRTSTRRGCALTTCRRG